MKSYLILVYLYNIPSMLKHSKIFHYQCFDWVGNLQCNFMINNKRGHAIKQLFSTSHDWIKDSHIVEICN